MTDAPLQRNLRVGNAVVGIIGLDVALNRVLGDDSLDDRQAAAQVYTEIAAANYIPPAAQEKYRAAIAREVERLRQGRAKREKELVIRILGPGCVSCNNIQKQVIEIMGRLGVAADIFQIHELDEIWRYGVLSTPALVINNEVKSAGVIPTPAQIEEWLREAVAA